MRVHEADEAPAAPARPLRPRLTARLTPRHAMNGYPM